MVCDACQKKLTKIVGIDPYRNKAHNKLTGVKKKPPPNENKLLGSEKKLALKFILLVTIIYGQDAFSEQL
ncbi:hypothetical protein OESDEN_11145 [Oesophagostomum dentatum]|uniref:Uncharacterized protein n=1 Tax=Oesophagostomum dentatum TaxID=61180 RepID=A0A0B1T0T8_OESDE|nr:hypothetical protein OESDEN_11145 [Oesophagostomum dentatum]